MRFTNRVEAGQSLAQALKKYQDQDAVVYALPRGGVVVAAEIAKTLHLPLDLIITRKIGHPQQPEYAIAAVAENGHMAVSPEEVAQIPGSWFNQEVEKQKLEARRRRETYLKGHPPIKALGKIAIIVDDGIATGLTIKAAIKEIKHQNPKRMVLGIPVAPKEVLEELATEVDEVVALTAPDFFLGAIGAYYEDFSPVEDQDVINIMNKFFPSEMKQSFFASQKDSFKKS